MILDLLFPKYCLRCNKLGRYICRDCLSLLRFHTRSECPACFSPSYLGKTHSFCKNKIDLDGVISIFRYEGFIKKLLKHTKYRFMKEIYNEIFSYIQEEDLLPFQSLLLNKEQIILQPIPLHDKRTNWRGFNQAELIAQFLSKKFSMSIVTEVKRVIHTKPQAYMNSKMERKANIAQAFKLIHAEAYRNKTVILVDDIFTSGSTANELARLIKEAEPRGVYLFALAHGSFS